MNECKRAVRSGIALASIQEISVCVCFLLHDYRGSGDYLGVREDWFGFPLFSGAFLTRVFAFSSPLWSFVQFVTQYQQAGGKYRLRATTVLGGWQGDNTQVETLVRGFDQEAAAVLMARIAVHRTETEEVTMIQTP